ncbi:MAG: hypothetical protein COB46_02585 [Rhodospirillaceae bacterium]|nr:MAG: hypothetical protein COB46_02585 [Rhodospirillaceae bacterium]
MIETFFQAQAANSGGILQTGGIRFPVPSKNLFGVGTTTYIYDICIYKIMSGFRLRFPRLRKTLQFK